MILLRQLLGYLILLLALFSFVDAIGASISDTFLGCSSSESAVVNQNSSQSITQCHSKLTLGWLLSDMAPARRGVGYVDLYPLTTSSRLILVGRYGMARRLLFDSENSCKSSDWQPCHLLKSCKPCLFTVMDSWFSDYDSLEINLEGHISDYCTSQYFFRLEYESYHMYLPREADVRTGPLSSMGSLDSLSDACPNYGEYFVSRGNQIHMCVIRSRDLLDHMPESKSSDKLDLSTTSFTPIANCSIFSSTFQMNRRRLSRVIIAADMPLRLAFAVGFVVLISGLYSARRWRTLNNTSTNSRNSMAAMLRMSAMLRYGGANRRGMRYTVSNYSYHARPLLLNNRTSNDTDNNEPELRVHNAPPSYENAPPPSYHEVVQCTKTDAD